MDPIQLQKQLRDNSTDLQECFKDIQKWGAEMKQKEAKMLEEVEKDKAIEEKEAAIPKKVAKISKTQEDSSKVSGKVPKDYKYWENFDVDSECEKLDKEKSDSDSELTDEFDDSAIELANTEKDKGNKFVKSGRYEDAIKCYSKAIDVYAYDPIYYSNRALCHIKLKHYKSAEADCTTSIQLDKLYVKAYFRRATARDALGQLREAEVDLVQAIELEPGNKECKNLLEKIRKKLGEDTPTTSEVTTQRPISKFTLSRQKQKEMSKDEKPLAVEAVCDKVIERKQFSGAKVEKLESVVPEVKEKISKIIKTVQWPNDDVELISSFTKAPKERSKARLKRVQVFDVDLKTDTSIQQKLLTPNVNIVEKEKPKAIEIEQLPPPPKPVQKESVDSKYEELNCSINISDLKDDFTKLNLPTPTTSVQFYSNWKNLRNDNEKKYLYLRQINPINFFNIFKDSFESKVFSEIIQCLAEVFIEKNVHVFEYLYGIYKVKRFSTLVMFKSKNDKEALFKLIDFMRTDESRSKEEVDFLIKKYEL